MATRRKTKESDYYQPVSKWCEKQFGCFHTAINRGLVHSRIDVIGLRDVGGDLSGNIEVIGIEVKRGNQPFATTSGQTAGYRVYADRVYLADVRDTDFTEDEKEIALHMGIGLIAIGGGYSRLRISERLTSPNRPVIERMQASLIDKLGYGRCCVCDSIFEARKNVTRSDKREDYLERAVDAEKGLVYWNEEVSSRRKPAADDRSDEYIYARRFVCPVCIRTLFGHLAETV